MNAEKRKEHILACAKKLFSQYGYYQTQISDIINEAGIARGTVYQYFKNKDAILITLLDIFYKDWIEAASVNTDSINLNEISPGLYLRSRIHKTLQFFNDDHDLCNIVLRMALGLHHIFESQILRFEKMITEAIIADLKLGKKFGRVRKDLNDELAAHLITGALFRISYNYFAGDRKDSKNIDIESITDEIVDILQPGLFGSSKK